MSIEKANKEYYDQIYYPGNTFWRWIHVMLSFDQNCKRLPNCNNIRPFLEGEFEKKKVLRILDYGCGWGLFLLSFPADKIEAYCYDISEGAMIGLEAIMEMLGRKVRRIDITEDGSIMPQKLDLVVCSHVLEHVKDDRGLIMKLTGALSPGGYLLVNVPINEIWDDPKHLRAYTPEVLKEVMADAGLEIALERQVCKWSRTLRRWEMGSNGSKVNLLILRGLRLFLAMMPYKLILWSERKFLSRENFHQLIVVGRKPV